MSEKFTKGPWLLGFMDNRTRIVIESEGSRYCVADIIDVSGVDLFNAALIAAAPDMYEMLSKLSGMATDIDAHALAKEIESLLARARGEA